ncbi:aminotransferase, partial [Absidia repens]
MEEPLYLLETILYDPNEGFYLLDLHLARLTRSAKDFQYPEPNGTCIKDLLLAQVPLENPQRVRLLYDIHGNTTIEYTTLPIESINSINTLDDQTTLKLNTQSPLKIVLDTQATLTVGQLTIQHKTTHRRVYTAARERTHAGTSDVFDVVLWNTNNQITETSIANIAIGKRSQQGNYIWKTPSLDCGLLPGVFRRYLLDQGKMVESKITTDDLIKAQQDGDTIICFNSVRKIYKVYLDVA